MDGMKKGGFLFAFDEFGAISMEDIIVPIGSKIVRPYSLIDSLNFPNEEAYNKLKSKWNLKIKRWNDDLLVPKIHRYVFSRDLKSMHDKLKLLPELNEAKFSFGSMGNS